MNIIFRLIFAIGGALLFIGLIVLMALRNTTRRHRRIGIIIIVSGLLIIIASSIGWLIVIPEETRSSKTTEITAAIEQIYSSETDGELYGVPNYAAKEILANYNPDDTNVLLVMQDYSGNWVFRYLYNAKDPEVLQAVKSGWTIVNANNKSLIIT